MNAQEAIEAAQKKFQLAVDLDKEEKEAKDAAADFKERAKAARAEAEAIILGMRTGQGSLFDAPPPEDVLVADPDCRHCKGTGAIDGMTCQCLERRYNELYGPGAAVPPADDEPPVDDDKERELRDRVAGRSELPVGDR